MSYFNTHTHRKPLDNTEISIRNAFLHPLKNIDTKYYLSTGLHPWFVNSYKEDEVISILEENIQNPKVIAIGEIGLDKTTSNFDLQKYYFGLQLNFAEKHKLPVIIHLVKSAEEFLPLIKKFKDEIILHGFNGGMELWNQLNINGKTNISIGNQVFKRGKQLTKIIKQIPLEHLFVETDQSNMSIKLIYNEISIVRGIPLNELKAQVSENFMRVFKTI